MEESARRSVSGGHRKITWEGESRVSNTPTRGASFLGTKWGTDRNLPDRVWDEKGPSLPPGSFHKVDCVLPCPKKRPLVKSSSQARGSS
jgi:hypothetical protein